LQIEADASVNQEGKDDDLVFLNDNQTKNKRVNTVKELFKT
jgi:hypothetical protein